MDGETQLAHWLMRLFGPQAGKMAQNHAAHQAWIGDKAGVERWRRVLALIALNERCAGRQLACGAG